MARRHIEKVEAHANRVLAPAHDQNASPADLIKLYKSFLKKEEYRIKLQHYAGLSGTEVCRQRSSLLDVVLRNLFDRALQESHAAARVALVASGGYGRGILNPGSDVDIQFLHPERGGRDLSAKTREVIEKVLYMLWDVGFKVGYGVRSLKETFQFAQKDHPTMCALIESRFITGDRALFDEFEDNFQRQCVTGREKEFLLTRARDLRDRHAKASNTVHLQEPNVKSGCGGLRDYHNMVWVSYVKLGIRDLDQLVRRRIFSETAGQEIQKAHDFLLRVRNDMHYAEKSAADLLTLRLQGVVATNLGYEGRRMVQRTEDFMRDYYNHSRHLYQHNLSLMERFELEQEEKKPGIFSFLAVQKKNKSEVFDGFHTRDGFIFPNDADIFKEDSGRLIRLFHQTQLRQLKLSPQIRRLVKENYALINRTFRYKKTNRETWEAILSRKGEVGAALRQMHRVGFLGRYIPEFAPLTDLVQHEFFHRYTADEHTLKCLERLDELSDTRDPKLAFHQRLFHELEDPFILYLALLMHDTGRAEGVKHHSYASTELTDGVCRRLQIQDKRRQTLLFLVDNHLLLWHTATTRNLDDPEVIAGFARIVRSREWLEALYLHTCADSRATNETGWTDWKESLVRQLYHATLAYLEGQEAFQSHMNIPLDKLRKSVTSELDDSYGAEIEAHLTGMPPRYFNFRGAADLTLHIRTCRQFFRQIRKDDAGSCLRPVLRWVAHPEQGNSEVILISWDRHLLLAKAAGALAANGLNILSADLFLREDGMIIDLFRVCTTSLTPVTSEKTIGSVNELLARACTGEEIDFASLIRGQDSNGSTTPLPGWQDEFPVFAGVHNEPKRDYTTVEIQAVDRIGLLYAIFNAIGSLGLEITHARVNTEKGAAVDSFCVTDVLGKKITDPAMLTALRLEVGKAAGIPQK
ncbi:MAG TPA: [protein-PII] uridylyltransferase [Verrucomicrobiales bacterium]|jgi:[protein-PII] uridylyltransferase|nr:[protein-PII] uridylyltransferase [Verrucomicrobiales bacterium]